MNAPAGGPEVTRGRESLAVAVEAERAAAAAVGRAEEEARAFRRVVGVALAVEQESIARAAERVAIESETYVRRTAR